MQLDDFENLVLLYVEEGEALFNKGWRCQQGLSSECHGNLEVSL